MCSENDSISNFFAPRRGIPKTLSSCTWRPSRWSDVFMLMVINIHNFRFVNKSIFFESKWVRTRNNSLCHHEAFTTQSLTAEPSCARCQNCEEQKQKPERRFLDGLTVELKFNFSYKHLRSHELQLLKCHTKFLLIAQKTWARLHRGFIDRRRLCSAKYDEEEGEQKELHHCSSLQKEKQLRWVGN